MLPEVARYDHILGLPKDRNLGDALIAAMKAIENSFEPLQGVLPKEYGIFERTVLEDLLKIFNRDALKTAAGDVFGRIYEYFLMEFAIQGAQDNGEFFTPPSIVQMIVNVIEPGLGTPFNPKAGSIVPTRQPVQAVCSFSQPFHRSHGMTRPQADVLRTAKPDHHQAGQDEPGRPRAGGRYPGSQHVLRGCAHPTASATGMANPRSTWICTQR